MNKKSLKRKKKASPKLTHTRNFMKGATKNGALYAVAIVALIATFGAVMAGGAIPKITPLSTPNPPGTNYTCCDSGDGAACHPNTAKEFDYNGSVYALLKSNIVAAETDHIVPTNQYTPGGQKIFTNNSNITSDYSDIPGCTKGDDLIHIYPPGGYPPCFGVPHDELLYVCTDTPTNCAQQIAQNQTPFDVYYRVSDGPVPSPLSTDCPKPSGSLNPTGQQIINIPTPAGEKNLQLQTFQVVQQQQPNPFDSPWCKPAINLYTPNNKPLSVHVQINPEGKMNYTDPTYPDNGWSVTAYPDGTIGDNNMTFPYLYWEAAIPDQLIPTPKDGYIVAYTNLTSTLKTILPETGLNQRETKQFIDYWIKALPQINYYFIGVIPQNQINQLAPLTITPKPDSLLRVSLYFKALDTKPQSPITPPQFSPFIRKGFVVTEWGGFFKADKNHPNFTCLM